MGEAWSNEEQSENGLTRASGSSLTVTEEGMLLMESSSVEDLLTYRVLTIENVGHPLLKLINFFLEIARRWSG
jgi:hypothetical protein